MQPNLSAATIAVQLTGGQFTGTSSQLTSGQSAGLTGFATTNWNVFNGDTGGDAVLDAQLSNAALVDNLGGSTSAQITTAGFDKVLLTSSANSTPDDKLFKHGFALSGGAISPGTISVTGLAASGYGTYDLNVYLSNDIFSAGSADSFTTLTINGNAISLQINRYDDTTFAYSDSTVIGGGNSGGHGNYVRLTGLTGNLSLSLASTSKTVGIDGFQITAVAVPEPSTYALMLGGLGALVFLRRRETSKA